MYWCQLNFAIFYVTSALSISWQHLNHPNLLVCSFYSFHVYLYIRLILHELSIPLPHEDGLSKVKNAYIQSAYYSVITMALKQIKHGCMGIGFIQRVMVFLATERSLPDNLTRWIITQSKGFTRKGMEQMKRSMRVYVYLVLTSQVQTRPSIVGNSAPAVDAQKVFKSTFKALINEDYSIDNRY